MRQLRFGKVHPPGLPCAAHGYPALDRQGWDRRCGAVLHVLHVLQELGSLAGNATAQV